MNPTLLFTGLSDPVRSFLPQGQKGLQARLASWGWILILGAALRENQQLRSPHPSYTCLPRLTVTFPLSFLQASNSTLTLRVYISQP